MGGRLPGWVRLAIRRVLRPVVSAAGLAVVLWVLGMLPASSGAEPMLGAVALLWVSGRYSVDDTAAGPRGHATHTPYSGHWVAGQAR